VTIVDTAQAAIAALQAGTIDAAFRAVGSAVSRLPAGMMKLPAAYDAHHLLVGPAHPLSAARSVTLGELAGRRIWMPGMLPGSEWDVYYDDLSAAFGLTIERVGPHFGTDHLLDVLAESSSFANLAGERTRLLWPDHYDLRRIPIIDPVPVYPASMIWCRDNDHPALGPLVAHLEAQPQAFSASEIWVPAWAR
jgi:hypothetical protein